MTLDLAKGLRYDTESPSNQKKKKKKFWTSSKLNFDASQDTSKKVKGQPTEGEEIFSNLYLMKDFHPEYIKSPYNSVTKTNHPGEKRTKD